MMLHDDACTSTTTHLQLVPSAGIDSQSQAMSSSTAPLSSIQGFLTPSCCLSRLLISCIVRRLSGCRLLLVCAHCERLRTFAVRRESNALAFPWCEFGIGRGFLWHASFQSYLCSNCPTVLHFAKKAPDALTLHGNKRLMTLSKLYLTELPSVK